MKSLDELKIELRETRSKIKEYAGLNDFSDEDLKNLEALKTTAAKLNAQITAKEETLAGEKEAEDQRKAEQSKAIADAVKAEREKWEAANRRPATPGYGAPYAMKFNDEAKYDGLSPADLSMLIDVQRSFAAKGVSYVNGEQIKVEGSALKAMARRIAELKDDNTEEGRQAVAYVKGSFKAATNIEPEIQSVDKAIKAATDPMYTGGSLVGSDWVGTAYSTELWRKIRAATRVVENIPNEVIPDGYSNKTWPLESTDMTWYKVAEATTSDATLKVPAATVTASQMATANKNITIGKLGARGLYTGELEEDSLIRFSSQLRAQMEVSGSEMLESLVIDGDVETSANKNINDIAGTPDAADYFLTFDGFRKLALVTNTANSMSAAGSLSIDNFLDLLKLMGTAGIAGSDPTKVAYIVDGNVHYALPKLPELKTKDVSSAATVENGFVKAVWNVPVIPSWQMHAKSTTRKANSAGKIDQDTVGNNLYGAVVAVRWDQWKLAYKRRMTMEVTRIANADTWEIVALTRLGLGYRDTEASAVLYYVGV